MATLKRLTLISFRNYETLEIQFSNAINIFIGDNAQGKTNLLESIYLLSITKSHKTFKDRDMIQFDKEFTRVSGELLKNDEMNRLEVILSSKGKKVAINAVDKKKMSEYLGFLNVVMFAPEDLDIVKRDPSVRRKFLDIEIGQTSPIYLNDLSNYNRLLKQRNEYLKRVIVDDEVDMYYLDTLTEQLSEVGYTLLLKRKSFIKTLNEYANAIHKHVSNEREQLTIEYHSTYATPESVSDVINMYKKGYKSDLKYGSTKLGIHRDDLTFYVNGKDVSRFGSQGQQRTTALAIKLAMIDFIKNETGQYPILLLDDVLSELDDTRQTLLLDNIKDKVQTFVTTTNVLGIQSSILKKAVIYTIDNGKIIQKEEGV